MAPTSASAGPFCTARADAVPKRGVTVPAFLRSLCSAESNTQGPPTRTSAPRLLRFVVPNSLTEQHWALAQRTDGRQNLGPVAQDRGPRHAGCSRAGVKDPSPAPSPRHRTAEKGTNFLGSHWYRLPPAVRNAARVVGLTHRALKARILQTLCHRALAWLKPGAPTQGKNIFSRSRRSGSA